MRQTSKWLSPKRLFRAAGSAWNLQALKPTFLGRGWAFTIPFLALAVLSLPKRNTGETLPTGVNARAEERVAELIQNALGPYRQEFDFKLTATNNWRVYTNLEATFREASQLMPSRLDLKFGIASALVGQALQTNQQFELKMREALHVYAQIHSLDTNDFQAAISLAAFTRALGQPNQSRAVLDEIMSLYPERTAKYLAKLDRADQLLALAPREAPTNAMSNNPAQVIVVLGAALETNGTMKAKLVGRLQQALILARLQPDASIVVTGGNQRGGITEAYAMSLWLQEQGVCPDRIRLEDQAKDTVGNALFSSKIIEKLGARRVTLVTNTSHTRRALAAFEQAFEQRGLILNCDQLAAPDEPDLDPVRERVAVYRDVLRASGLWSYPGIQR